MRSKKKKKNNKINFIVSVFLCLVAIIFTILVKVIDVQPVGVNGTDIGFAKINSYVFSMIGENAIWYDITYYLGIVAILVAFVYALIGGIQLFKRKSVFKVDKEIIFLGIFYFVVVGIYAFFEKVVVNYRPILMDGVIEASYPSSHTLMTICLCGSAIIINKKLFNIRYINIVNIFLGFIIGITVVGRLISGVHWFTDILGGIIISMALLMTFYSFINSIDKK